MYKCKPIYILSTCAQSGSSLQQEGKKEANSCWVLVNIYSLRSTLSHLLYKATMTLHFIAMLCIKVTASDRCRTSTVIVCLPEYVLKTIKNWTNDVRKPLKARSHIVGNGSDRNEYIIATSGVFTWQLQKGF